jgi:TRAP-type C4-dicarboxylate transport system permease large subunit
MRSFVLSIFGSVTSFVLLPLPLSILMGEIMYHGGLAPNMISALDKWMGRLTGRLSILAIMAGTLFANLSGSSLGSAAMLGSTLLPDMVKRGYKKPMILGPIMAGGCLAAMIPPTGLGILVGAVGEISIGKLLIAIYIPGLLLGVIYLTYIIVRCKLQPHMAPPYAVPNVSLSQKFVGLLHSVLPVGFIFLWLLVLFSSALLRRRRQQRLVSYPQQLW